jgi:hypothetical protein
MEEGDWAIPYMGDKKRIMIKRGKKSLFTVALFARDIFPKHIIQPSAFPVYRNINSDKKFCREIKAERHRSRKG